jgi:hypothetical protein
MGGQNLNLKSTKVQNLNLKSIFGVKIKEKKKTFTKT